MAKIKVSLPKGFTAISSGGGSGWKPEKPGASLEGVKTGTKVVHFDAKKKGAKVIEPARDVNVHQIKTKDGDFEVWESAGLRALKDVKKGKPVFIQYVGKKNIGAGKAPMREYVVATK